jgi:hypothetical protein
MIGHGANNYTREALMSAQKYTNSALSTQTKDPICLQKTWGVSMKEEMVKLDLNCQAHSCNSSYVRG